MSSLFSFSSQSFSEFPRVELQRDLRAKLSQGHQWIFHDAIGDGPRSYKGPALLTFKGKTIALGAYDGSSDLRFRFLAWTHGKDLSQELEQRWRSAICRRKQWIDPGLRGQSKTDSFRLIFGEGDFFPGIVVDVFHHYAVVQLDRPWLRKIWNLSEWSAHLQRDLPFLKGILLKAKLADGEEHEEIWGEVPDEITFLENGMRFQTTIRQAAKTGFFLDQRENRQLLEHFSYGQRTANFFAYTGGFSLFAARGGATEVVSVDIAPAAVAAIERHFEINELSSVSRQHLCADAFALLEEYQKQKEKFGLVVVDPPSFAPNESSRPSALRAYQRAFAAGMNLVGPRGRIALSSCSGHINLEDFTQLLKDSAAAAKRSAQVVAWGRQPSDHPYPLAMPELHYLKFCLLELD